MSSPSTMFWLQIACVGRHLLGRHFASELALQDLHGLERVIDRLLADHHAEARQVASDHVVERAMAGMALDVLEQERRAFLAADQIGDGRRFEIGIDFCGDALELAQCLDLLQPGVEIAAIGSSRSRSGFGFLGFLMARGGTNFDAHVHVRLPSCCLPIQASATKSTAKPPAWNGLPQSDCGAKHKSPACRPGFFMTASVDGALRFRRSTSPSRGQEDGRAT